MSAGGTVGVKYDGGKHRMRLLGPLWRPIKAVVRVLEFGAKKYSEHSWLKLDGDPHRLVDAALRHIADWQEARIMGLSEVDKESGLHLLGHAACSLLFALYFVADENARETDDEVTAAPPMPTCGYITQWSDTPTVCGAPASRWHTDEIGLCGKHAADFHPSTLLEHGKEKSCDES